MTGFCRTLQNSGVQKDVRVASAVPNRRGACRATTRPCNERGIKALELALEIGYWWLSPDKFVRLASVTRPGGGACFEKRRTGGKGGFFE